MKFGGNQARSGTGWLKLVLSGWSIVGHLHILSLHHTSGLTSMWQSTKKKKKNILKVVVLAHTPLVPVPEWSALACSSMMGKGEMKSGA